MGGTSGVQLLQATGWGLLSSVSLLIGCTIGLIKLPGPKFRAVLMAFGGGSLINAVTIELFGEVLHKQAEFGIGITMTCLGAAAFGGGVFATINKALNDRAGFVRRLGSVGGARRLLQRVQQRRLIKRLIQVRQLQLLSQRELARLSTRLYKETYYQIFGMWLLMFVGTGCGALVGSLLFPEDLEETNREYGVAVIAGVCGGATLAMVANTLLPEAFEQGGDVVGLSCLAGFMTAMMIKSIGIQLSGEEHAAGCIGANSTATIVGDDLTH